MFTVSVISAYLGGDTMSAGPQSCVDDLKSQRVAVLEAIKAAEARASEVMKLEIEAKRAADEARAAVDAGKGKLAGLQARIMDALAPEDSAEKAKAALEAELRTRVTFKSYMVDTSNDWDVGWRGIGRDHTTYWAEIVFASAPLGGRAFKIGFNVGRSYEEGRWVKLGVFANILADYVRSSPWSLRSYHFVYRRAHESTCSFTGGVQLAPDDVVVFGKYERSKHTWDGSGLPDMSGLGDRLRDEFMKLMTCR